MSEQRRAQSRERWNKALFDWWAKSYDQGRITRWFQYTQELTIANLDDLVPSSRVLDVGCGTGHATVRLGSLVPEGRTCGIDTSEVMIAEAGKKVPREAADRVEFRRASSDDIPYADGVFTHMICTNSFHHYPDPIKALREMGRVLEPGGQLVIFENAPDLSWYTWAWDKLLRLVEPSHIRYYPSRELGEMIARAGYERLELRLLKNEFRKHGKLFASVQIWSARTPGADRPAGVKSPAAEA